MFTTRAVVSLADGAYSEVRQMIMHGTLGPSTIVRETELARRLGMSRTPVREALLRLQTEGLISSVAHGGYVVIEVSPCDLVNVYEVRSVLEGLAARLAASRASRTDHAELEELVEQMQIAIAHSDDAELAKLNSRFHEAIANASQNSMLLSMLGNIRSIFEHFRLAALVYPGRRDEAHNEHREMICLLKARDSDGAERIAREHVKRALAVRVDMIENADRKG